MQHNAFLESLLHFRKNTKERRFDNQSFLNFDCYCSLDLDNDRFSNIEFEEDITD